MRHLTTYLALSMLTLSCGGGETMNPVSPNGLSGSAGSTMSGAYVVTFTAGQICRLLPEDAQRRTYTATVAQQGPRIDVTLGGANFAEQGLGGPLNKFWGRIDGGSVTFEMYGPDGLEAIVERLNPRVTLSLWGNIAGVVQGSAIAATFDGSFRREEWDEDGQLISVAQCDTRDHRVTFTKK